MPYEKRPIFELWLNIIALIEKQIVNNARHKNAVSNDKKKKKP